MYLDVHFRVCQHLFIQGVLIGCRLLSLLVIGSFQKLLETSGVRWCLGLPLMIRNRFLIVLHAL